MKLEILSLMSPKELMQHFGEKVKKRRKHLGLSRRGLSEKSGVSTATITRLETQGIATLQILIKVAIAMDSIETFENLFDVPSAKTLAEFKKEQK